MAQNTTQWAKKVFQLYSNRYTLGVINYIDLSKDTEREALSFPINVNVFQRFRFLATIELICSLNGSRPFLKNLENLNETNKFNDFE